MANPLSPVRLQNILKEMEQMEKEEVSCEDEGEDEVSMIFYGDEELDEESCKTSQEPCYCSRNSKCQTKKFCLCFKNNVTCVPMCHVNSGFRCKNVKKISV